jgi:glucosamine--fructose-6-phosphate aminotransferase (isomerizing)
MCGIIGIVGRAPVAPLLLDALKRLEYRGYDSAGIATLVNGGIDRRRAEGKLVNLAERLETAPIDGTTGIGHTRWATHGRPSERNAHPHANDRVAVVHNGIIENFRELKRELEAGGAVFETETDTEAIVHLITAELDRQASPQQAFAAALGRLDGAFALAVLFAGRHDLLMGARRGSPMAVGYGEGEMYVGSDALALAPLTSRLSYLEEGDWVELTGEGATIHDHTGALVERQVKQSAISGAAIGKGEHRHFMQKEIFEQPSVIGDTLHQLVDPATRQVTLPDLPFDLGALSRVTLTACGTAHLAGLTAKYWLEQLARQPVEADLASELRYREPPMPDGGLTIAVSQSGETVETQGALHYAKGQGQRTLAIVNVAESAIARDSEAVIQTLAGPEIGVASTKAFTTQLTVLACFAVAVGRARGQLDAEAEGRLTDALIEVPARAAEILNHDGEIRRIAQSVAEARDVLYLGRGAMYPLALEGALKLKEISYIHAEGYAAGEMKHGPIALIDEHVPVICCAPSGPLFPKMASNVQEVIARGGRVILLSDKAGIEAAGEGCWHTIELPAVDPFVAPILYAIPVQLLAYHVAVAKGTDVDQPRNLAKAVTVE